MERDAIAGEFARLTQAQPAEALLAMFAGASIPATRILDVRAVRELEQLRGRLMQTRLPDGRGIRMQPPAVEREGLRRELPFPPRYGADTRRVLAEAGCSRQQIEEWAAAGVIAG
ncbi:MAG: CoA transferase [Steroidobacteraceae bacterium]